MIARRAKQRIVAASALALSLPVLVGCGMEAKDETQKEHAQIQAASNHIGDVVIRNAFITTLPSDDAASAGTTYLVVTLVNHGDDPDFFTGVSTPLGAAELSNPVTLPPGVVVQVSDPEINEDAATLTIATSDAPTVGTTEPVAFSFTTAGTTRNLEVPVVNPGGSLSPTQVIPTVQATAATPIV